MCSRVTAAPAFHNKHCLLTQRTQRPSRYHPATTLTLAYAMTKEKKKSVKEREGLKSQVPRTTRKRNMLPFLQDKDAAREWLRSGEDGNYDKNARRIRLARLHEEILGPSPTFRSSITIPDDHKARADDSIRLSDIAGACAAGTAIVYFTDGSYKREGPIGGFIGAGVVWRYRGRIEAKGYQLGPCIGDATDAELFAIAAALGKRRNWSKKERVWST